MSLDTKKLTDKIFKIKAELNEAVINDDIDSFNKLALKLLGYIECCEDIGFLEKEMDYYTHIMFDILNKNNKIKLKE